MLPENTNYSQAKMATSLLGGINETNAKLQVLEWPLEVGAKSEPKCTEVLEDGS